MATSKASPYWESWIPVSLHTQRQFKIECTAGAGVGIHVQPASQDFRKSMADCQADANTLVFAYGSVFHLVELPINIVCDVFRYPQSGIRYPEIRAPFFSLCTQVIDRDGDILLESFHHILAK